MTPSEIFPGSNILIHEPIDSGLLLLAGPPGVGKSTFCKQSIYNSLSDGNPIVYMATEESPPMIVETMSKFGWDPSPYMEKGTMRIIDSFSHMSDDSLFNFCITNPEDLSEVSETLDKASSGLPKIRFVLDSITSLALNVGPGAGQRFIRTIINKLRASRALGICVLDAGILDETFLNFLRFIFDGVLEMTLVESKGKMQRLIRVYSLKMGRHDTDWHEFQITNRGITIKPQLTKII